MKEHIDYEAKQVQEETIVKLAAAFHRFDRKEMELHTFSNDKRMSEWRILLILNNVEPRGMRVSELSKKLRVTSPFVTQQLNSLEERDLITRVKDEEDRRVVRILITGKGRRVAEEVKDHHDLFFTDLVQYLGEEDSIQMAKLLHRTFDFIESKMGGERGY